MFLHPQGFFVLDQGEFVPDIRHFNKLGDLIAVSEHISSEMLIDAYQKGVFPWNDASSPYLWYSPKERMIITPESLKIPKSMKGILRNNIFTVTYDRNFADVVDNCATVKGREDTWIHEGLKKVLLEAHHLGMAKSVEAWRGSSLVGGLFGIQCTSFFSGDSMFSKVSNASKAAFLTFAEGVLGDNIKLIDCQVPSNHLSSMGGFVVGRKEFLKLIQ